MCGGLVLVLPGESSRHIGQAQGPYIHPAPPLVPTQGNSYSFLMDVPHMVQFAYHLSSVTSPGKRGKHDQPTYILS